MGIVYVQLAIFCCRAMLDAKKRGPRPLEFQIQFSIQPFWRCIHIHTCTTYAQHMHNICMHTYGCSNYLNNLWYLVNIAPSWGWSAPWDWKIYLYIYHKIEAKYKGKYSNPTGHLGFCWVNFQTTLIDVSLSIASPQSNLLVFWSSLTAASMMSRR